MTHPDREGIRSMINESVNPLIAELRWQRWLLFAVLAATLSPKVGGPTPPTIASALFEGVARAAGA